MESNLDYRTEKMIVKQEGELEDLKKRQLKERSELSLWRSPVKTLTLCISSILTQLRPLLPYLFQTSSLLILIFATFSAIIFAANSDSEHEVADEILSFLSFSVWWISLGIASSIGLGSGLQTFVLYLGPHIARFTLKATACGRVDLKIASYDTPTWTKDATWSTKNCSAFGSPQYEYITAHHGGYYSIPLIHIVLAVQLEAFLWGIGAAVGELPPYFVARAGITCGHLLVPFWKFFLATLIGKSTLKMFFQTSFIVAVFNTHSIEILEDALECLLVRVPVLRKEVPRIMSFLDEARERLTASPATNSSSKFSLSSVWNTFVAIMCLAFLSSIVTTIARSCLVNRQHEELRGLLAKQNSEAQALQMLTLDDGRRQLSPSSDEGSRRSVF